MLDLHLTSWQYPEINYLALITTFYSSFCSPPSSVVFWLRELCLVHEAECTIMLQSKPVGGSTSVGPAINGTGGPCAGADGAGAGSTYNQTHLGNFWAGNSKDTIRAIQSRAHAISAVLPNFASKSTEWHFRKFCHLKVVNFTKFFIWIQTLKKGTKYTILSIFSLCW